MFRRVLVAVDGSRHSHRALTKAAELVKGQKSEVLGLVHVRPTIETWTRTYGYEVAASLDLHQKMLRSLEENARRLLQQEAERARAAAGSTKVVVHDEAGVVTARIEAVVRDGEYDLLVMGSRGMGRAAGLLLGSVSQALLAKLPCSILVVRLEDEEQAPVSDV